MQSHLMLARYAMQQGRIVGNKARPAATVRKRFVALIGEPIFLPALAAAAVVGLGAQQAVAALL